MASPGQASRSLTRSPAVRPRDPSPSKGVFGARREEVKQVEEEEERDSEGKGGGDGSDDDGDDDDGDDNDESSEEDGEGGEAEDDQERETSMLRKTWTSETSDTYYGAVRVGGKGRGGGAGEVYTYCCGDCVVMETTSGK